MWGCASCSRLPGGERTGKEIESRRPVRPRGWVCFPGGETTPPADPVASPCRTSTPSRFPPPLRERLVRITAGLLLFLPELEELAVLPAPPGLLRPLAHHVFVLTRLQHLTGDLRPDDHVVAHAARLAVVV